jgi:hypothetical protein
MGIFHFFVMLRWGKYSKLKAASSVGDKVRVLITLRNDIFSDSMALVV